MPGSPAVNSHAANIAAKAYRTASGEEALVEQHLPLVKTTVDRMRIYLPPTMDLDDLYSVGVTGLMSAARKFDPTQNTAFSSFATLHIRGAVQDELRRMDWVPRSIRDKARHYRESVGLLEQRLGRAATDGEITEELALTQSQHHQLLEEIKPASFVPLDGDAYQEDGDSISLHDLIADDSQTCASDTLHQKDLLQLVVNRLQELPEMQRKVLALYYFEELRVSEIAAAFGVTEGRISQIHTQAVQTLRAFIRRSISTDEKHSPQPLTHTTN